MKKFEKGHKKVGGRQKGGENKISIQKKLDLALIAEDMVVHIEPLLEQVMIDSPERALNIILNLMEFRFPKLARTEITGKDGDELKINIVTEDKTVNEIINKI